MEYYDEESLSFIGNSFGRTIKVDLKTATQARGLFAIICHQLNQYFGRTQTPIAGRSLTRTLYAFPVCFLGYSNPETFYLDSRYRYAFDDY